MGKRFPPDSATPKGDSTSNHSMVKYREFDEPQIAKEIVKGATEIRAAIEHYENAKTVSQRVLDSEVCI
jgi:hypothetical protein